MDLGESNMQIKHLDLRLSEGGTSRYQTTGRLRKSKSPGQPGVSWSYTPIPPRSPDLTNPLQL